VIFSTKSASKSESNISQYEILTISGPSRASSMIGVKRPRQLESLHKIGKVQLSKTYAVSQSESATSRSNGLNCHQVEMLVFDDNLLRAIFGAGSQRVR
jgi:hypothetical protein